MKKTWQDRLKHWPCFFGVLGREKGLPLWHAAREIGLAWRLCRQRGTQSCLDER